MATKICTKCKEEKDLSEFGKNSRAKDGKLVRCKVCRNEYSAFHYANNKDKKKAYVKANKEHTKKYQKEYRERNKEKIKQNNKKYNDDNKESLKEYRKKYREDNRDIILKRERDWHINKIKKSPIYKLAFNIRGLILASIKSKNCIKNTKTINILGCTGEEFKEYLEDNPYNFKIGQIGLDLDHIIPTSSAKTEEEVYLLNHYTNFQLLPSYYNRHLKRDNNWDRKDFEEWLKTNSI